MNDPRNQSQVQKMELTTMPLKKSYKIWLDTNNTASYIGKQFDANFYVDMNTIIQDVWRLKSSYEMTFSFLSRSPTQADQSASGLTTEKLFKISIDLGKGTPTMYQFSQTKVPSGLVRVSNIGVGYYTKPADAGAFNIPAYFVSIPDDNGPVFINNLLGVSNIQITLTDAISGGIFNSADNAGINISLKYICCVCLQEL